MTYLAWDINLRVRIAIKEFLPRQLAARVSGGTQVYPYTSSQDAFNIGLEQFLSEARNLAQFRDHAGIISVLDFFPENGTGYMVMEYLDGSTLEQYISANSTLDIPVILGLLVPVADALRACHAAGLIHRDISPDNIFLTSDGRVKVLDFGAARFAVGSRSTNLSVILKEGYAPFEQYQRNGRQGPWTDIYALTATLYRLLTGDLPITAPDRVAGMRLPSPSEKGVKLPPGLQTLLDKGLAIRPEQRYQAIDAFLSDLQAVLETLSKSSPRVRLSRGQRKRIITFVGATALIGGVAAPLYLWIHPDSPWVQPTSDSGRPVKEIVSPNLPPTDGGRPVKEIGSPNLPPTDGGKPLKEIALPTEDPSEPPLSATQKGPSIESMREYVRRAAQYQIQLRLAVAQTRGASNSLDKLRAITVKPDAIQKAIQTQENLYSSSVRDRDTLLNKYMAEVEWLGGYDETTVEYAVKLESDTVNTPSIEKGEADNKAQIQHAINLLASDLRVQRQNQLTRDRVIANAN